MIAPDAVVTFERVDGFRVVKSFGYAYGQATRPRNILRATFRSHGAFIGLARSSTSPMPSVRAPIVSPNWCARPKRPGANGIIRLAVPSVGDARRLDQSAGVR